MRLAFRSGGEALQPGTVRLPCQVPVTESVVASGNPITADFTYVRFLGDRKSIEEQTKVWDKVFVDRRAELSEWADILGKVHKRKIQIFAYANNHFAGFGPATVEMFQDLWRRLVKEETKSGKAGTLLPI